MNAITSCHIEKTGLLQRPTPTINDVNLPLDLNHCFTTCFNLPHVPILAINVSKVYKRKINFQKTSRIETFATFLFAKCVHSSMCTPNWKIFVFPDGTT